MAKNPQPNFEVLKTAFYRTFLNGWFDEKVNTAILMEGVQIALQGKVPASAHWRMKQFQEDFNQWLSHVDIRQCGELIDIILQNPDKVRANNVHIPGWMKRKAYRIDYGESGALDLLPNTMFN